MTTPYFESAEEAASGLRLALLLAASAETAVPRAAAKLSDLAVETMLGGRLYNRMRLPEPKGGQVLWICGPHGALEHLRWAVAVAEHAAGYGRSSYLLDASTQRPLESLAAGRGLDLPEAVQDRIESLGLGSAAGWTSDLAGVRIVLPTGEPPAGGIPPEPARWTLIVSRALPDAGSQPSAALCSGVDGIIFVAAIRDHSREELVQAVAMLRALDVPLLGFIALGPVSKPRLTPLERWDRIDPWALADSKKEAPTPAAPAPVSPLLPVSSPLPLSPPQPVSPPQPLLAPPPAEPVVARGIEPEMAPISLGTWGAPREPRRVGRWILPAAFLSLAIAGTVYLRWWAPRSAEEPPETAVLPARGIMADTTSGEISPALPDSTGSEGLLWDSIVGNLGGAAPESVSVNGLMESGWPDTFVVHVNSFNHETFAGREAARLRVLGLPARVVSIELPMRGRWYRVIVGAYPDSAAALNEAALLTERQLVSFAQILDRGGRGNPRKSAPQ
jgi:hypothetical protein